jgi:hypothetical protein
MITNGQNYNNVLMFIYAFGISCYQGQKMSVDQFLSAEERVNFAARQAAVLETAEHHGVSSEDTLLIGGGALALHGIDTYVPNPLAKFDLEGIVIEQDSGRRAGVLARWRKQLPPNGSYSEDPEAPLSMTRVGGRAAVNFARDYFKYPSYDSMVHDRVVLPSGLATLPVGRLVYGKVRGIENGRAKDEAGIIKAHVIAEATGHKELINDPFWLSTIAYVMKRATEQPAPSEGERPGWMKDLIRTGFDHPAFTSVRKKS